MLILFLIFIFSQDIDEAATEHNDCYEHDKQVQGFLVEQASYNSGKNDRRMSGEN
jgi:hypothetical protein